VAQVLVVEDDEMIRDVITANLIRAGHHVLEAGSGNEAIAEVSGREPSPEIAVLDIGLPDIDGFSLAGALRRLPGLGALPVIFLSGRVGEDDIAAGRALGCTYLTKPFIAATLLGAIDRDLASTARF
jgi:DNA-binding response OmpR family regulator